MKDKNCFTIGVPEGDFNKTVEATFNAVKATECFEADQAK